MDFKLIVKKINGALTEEEEVIFNEWFEESKDHQDYFNDVVQNYKKHPGTIDINKAWSEVNKKIGFKSKKVAYLKYAAAASIALIIGLAFFYKDSIDNEVQNSAPKIANKEVIEAGTDKAVLQLETGNNVVLEKGKEYVAGNFKSNGEQLTYNASDTNSTTYNILTVPRGGQFQVVLADGTSVFLNSESKLRYPVTFSENVSRKVELLYGEAYFDVSPSTKNNGTHFIVVSQNQEIEVLGTEFNIKAYKEDPFIATTLVEGKVLVRGDVDSVSLKPNYQSILNLNDKKITVSSIDVYNEISWKMGVFSFKNKSLKEIMAVLSRWYDVEVIFGDDKKFQTTFNGSFNKKQKLQEILRSIESTNEAKFNIKGKTIYMK